MAGPDLDAGRLGLAADRARELLAQIEHGDGNASRSQIERGAIGAIVAGEQHGAAAGQHGVAVQIAAHRARQHDPGPVVVGEHQRPLERAGRQHHLLGPYLPEPLAGQMRGRCRSEMVGDPLDQAQIVVVVVGECRGPGQDAKFGQRLQLGRHLREPGGTRMTHGLIEQRAAKLGLLLGQEHARAAPPRRERRCQASGPGADDQDVAMGEAVLIAVGIGLDWRLAQACRPPDRALVDALPPGRRPHEGLVVEAGREQRAQKVADRADVELDRGPAVLAAGDEALVELDLGRPDIGLGARALAELDQRVRLLGAGRDDAARAMVFEAPADQVDAVREQRGRQRVAGEALVADAVEGEAQRARAVDPPTLRQPMARPVLVVPAHDGGSSDAAPGAGAGSTVGRGSPIR